MYILIIVFTIIGLFVLNRLQKGLFRDISFLWLVIINLKLVNSIEHKDIFEYLVLFFLLVQLYVLYIKKEELFYIMKKNFKRTLNE